MIPLDYARYYMSIKLTVKAAAYQSEFFGKLKECALANGGSVSRNGHRVAFPWTGPSLCPEEDSVGNAGNYEGWPQFRDFVKSTLKTLWFGNPKKFISKIDYIKGTCTVEYSNGSKNTVKIGKILVKENVTWRNTPAIELFTADPIRLGKDIQTLSDENRLCIIVSDHPYDIAGMSYDRSWTSCMNIEDGDCREMVECDIHHGTLVAYLCECTDTNINRPYARFLIKPYKLQRPGYTGFSPCQMIYYPERTVYSAYVGLSPLLRWGEAVCKSLQSGSGILRKLPFLYEDTCREKKAVQRKFEGYVKNPNE